MRKLRIAISSTVAVLIAVALSGWSLGISAAFGWLDRIQFLHLLVTGVVVQCLVWLILTWLFGRLYCSWFCPLGTFQDLGGKARELPPLRRFTRQWNFTPELQTARLVITALLCICLLAGFLLPVVMLDPGVIYARMVSLVAPELGILTITGAATTVALLLILYLSFKRGRLWCNSVCPVGTILGYCSKYAVHQIRINPDLCTGCGKCLPKCKSLCINLADLSVDNSRCVYCFNCTAACPEKAITYTRRSPRPATPLLNSK